MTDNLKEKIKKLPEFEPPTDLHDKIMRKLYFKKFQTPFVIAIILLSLNLFISGWRLWSRIAELDTLPTLSSLFEGFEFSLNYFSDFITTLNESFPFRIFMIFFLNGLLLIYVRHIFSQLKKLYFNKRSNF